MSYKHHLVGACPCGMAHGGRLARTPRDELRQAGTEERAGPAERDAIYRAVLDLLCLRESAVANLGGRGLSEAAIASSLFRSIPRKGKESHAFLGAMEERFGRAALERCPGFLDKNGKFSFVSAFADRDGFLVPFVGLANQITGLQVRFLSGSALRYMTLAGSRVAEMHHLAGEPQRTLYATEGALKAEVASLRGGLWVMGVPGQVLAPQHIDVVRALHPQRVMVALDREHNRQTEAARTAWLTTLADAGLPVGEAVWEVHA